MSKIICDVCGTVYQDTADCCPICGYTKNGVRLGSSDRFSSPADDKTESFLSDMPQKHKAIFDFDEVNPDEEETDTYEYNDGEFYEEEPPRSNIFLIIILVVAITLLLVGIGYLLFRYYLPNASSEAPSTEAVYTQPFEDDQTEQTTEPRIPCTNLVLTSGVTELNKEGQYWLLHVTVLPEDTTDVLSFVSEDESIVTVNEHGRITAVGEGETNIFITCGEKEIKCKVVVRFEETQETEDESAGMTEPASVDHETLPGETDEPAETTQATEPAQTVVLKLEKQDVSCPKRGVSFDLKLDCDLKPEDVTWLTLDSSVAIVKNGEVTTIGPGRTKIVAQYQGQQVECIIRCTFS